MVQEKLVHNEHKLITLPPDDMFSDTCEFYYINLQNLMQILLKDESFKKSKSFDTSRQDKGGDDNVHDVIDGTHFRSLPASIPGRAVLTPLLYSDEVVTVNHIGKGIESSNFNLFYFLV